MNADLLQVRTQLFSLSTEDNQARRHAVNRVMAWKLRGNLPHAVESTALLIDAILHHDSNINSSFSIRAVYSAAFSRFVTGFCDIGRHKERTLEPISMLEIARQIDMPADFVALRHEATHEELPGLKRLTHATQQALDWLWRVYWSRLDETAGEEAVAMPSDVLRSELSSVLRAFRRELRNLLRAPKSSTHHDTALEVQRTCAKLEELGHGAPQLSTLLISTMLGERLILPADMELGSSLRGAFLLWDDLILELSRRFGDFVRDLGMAMLDELARSSGVRPDTAATKEGFADWLIHLLSIHIKDVNGQVDFAAELMKGCCLYPGYWTRKVAARVLERGNESFKEEWRDLLEASMEGSESDSLAGAEKRGADGEALALHSHIQESAHGRAESWSRTILPPIAPMGVV